MKVEHVQNYSWGFLKMQILDPVSAPSQIYHTKMTIFPKSWSNSVKQVNKQL